MRAGRFREAVAILVATCAGVAPIARAAPPLHVTIPDLGHRSIVVDVTSGRVEIGTSQESGVRVSIVSEHTSEKDLEMAVEDTSSEVRVRAVRRGAAVAEGRDVVVTLVIPAAATVRKVTLGRGDLNLTGLRGEVQATVDRGNITAVSLSGVTRLETQAGDITVTDAEPSPAGLLKLRTLRGNIRLEFRRRPDDARILALTLGGRIESDLPLAERTGFGQRFREAVFGNGTQVISVDSVRGDITITAPGVP